MRISKAALLILVAFIVPIVVELRTVLAWFHVELTVLESIVLAVAMIAAVLLWAVWPENGAEPNSG
ncbi:CbaC protein [Natronobacterium texcoconense]|uniref:CbaC protein n=1 Tax=Natronobacterium texcoconense TaxID=1095778 RepID=UPI000B8399E3|nr:CbaC protein [Natronobacterium texcoconense]